MHKAHAGCTRMLSYYKQEHYKLPFYTISLQKCLNLFWVNRKSIGSCDEKHSKCDQETNKVFLMLILKEQQLHRQHLQGKKHCQLGTMINWKSVTEQPQWRLPAQERSSKTFKNKESHRVKEMERQDSFRCSRPSDSRPRRRPTSLMAVQNSLWRTFFRDWSLWPGTSPDSCSFSSSSIALATSGGKRERE